MPWSLVFQFQHFICLQEQNHERSELSNLQPILKPRKKGFLPICFHTFFFSIDKTIQIEISVFLLCNTFVKILILGLISNYLANSFHAVIKVSHKKEQHYVCMFVSMLQLKYCSAYRATWPSQFFIYAQQNIIIKVFTKSVQYMNEIQ